MINFPVSGPRRAACLSWARRLATGAGVIVLAAALASCRSSDDVTGSIGGAVNTTPARMAALAAQYDRAPENKGGRHELRAGASGRGTHQRGRRRAAAARRALSQRPGNIVDLRQGARGGGEAEGSRQRAAGRAYARAAGLVGPLCARIGRGPDGRPQGRAGLLCVSPTHQRGMDRETWNCSPRCQPTFSLGDSNKFSSENAAQMQARNASIGSGARPAGGAGF